MNHISGELNMHLVDNKITVTDYRSGVTKTLKFKSIKEALRFVGEYILNTEGPTNEFRQLLPEMC